MKTPFGNVVVGNQGYYVVTSNTEYHGKLLHRLLFQKYWRTEIPNGYFIHHKDGNKLNNCIMNLQLMEKGEHSKLHCTGYKHEEDVRRKISNLKKGKSIPTNKTGYYRVYKETKKDSKKGFCYTYEVDESRLDTNHRRKKKIRRTDLNKLEKEVKRQGYVWKRCD